MKLLWKYGAMKYADPDKKCIICAKPNVDLHHVKSRGSGGTDDDWNLMPLRHKYHQELHAIGMSEFIWKYPIVRVWLETNGWYYDDYAKKWLH